MTIYHIYIYIYILSTLLQGAPVSVYNDDHTSYKYMLSMSSWDKQRCCSSSEDKSTTHSLVFKRCRPLMGVMSYNSLSTANTAVF